MSKLAKKGEPRFVGADLVRADESDDGTVSFEVYKGGAWIPATDKSDDFFFKSDGTLRAPSSLQELAAMGLGVMATPSCQTR